MCSQDCTHDPSIIIVNKEERTFHSSLLFFTLSGPNGYKANRFRIDWQAPSGSWLSNKWP